ncbi:MAG: hypothetical protein ACFFBD_23765, partial [Candidatus Hodarchaeota archaeon]
FQILYVTLVAIGNINQNNNFLALNQDKTFYRRSLSSLFQARAFSGRTQRAFLSNQVHCL